MDANSKKIVFDTGNGELGYSPKDFGKVAICGAGDGGGNLAKALAELDDIHISDPIRGKHPNMIIVDSFPEDEVPKRFGDIPEEYLRIKDRVSDFNYELPEDGWKGSSTKRGFNQKQINKRRKRNKNKKTHRRK